MSITARAAFAALLSVSLACASGPAGPAAMAHGVTADAPRQTLEAADSLLATRIETVGAADGFRASLADDALFLEPGLDIVRGEAIHGALTARRSGSQAATTRLHRVASGQSADAGLGFTFGWVEERADGAAPQHAKYLAIWRTEDGRWRLKAFAWMGGLGPPSAAPDRDPWIAGYRGIVSPGDPARLAAEVARADSAFAALANAETLCAAFTAFADRNAVVFARADFRWGIDAVGAAHKDCTAADRGTWAPIESAAAASGDLAYTVGNATFSSPVSPSHLKYLTVWTRQADGRWKWLLDAGSPRPAPRPESRDLTRDSGRRAPAGN